jgi:hypothetical protein
MTDPTTDIEVGIDPNGEAPRKEPAIQVSKWINVPLVVGAIGIIGSLAARTWTGVICFGITFTVAIIAMLVIAEIERRRK